MKIKIYNNTNFRNIFLAKPMPEMQNFEIIYYGTGQDLQGLYIELEIKYIYKLYSLIDVNYPAEIQVDDDIEMCEGFTFDGISGWLSKPDGSLQEVYEDSDNYAKVGGVYYKYDTLDLSDCFNI
jgi:hypothetical protein